MKRDQEYIVGKQEIEQSQKHDQTSEHSSKMNVQTNVNLTKKKRVIFWIYLVTILGFAITIAAVSSQAFQISQQFIKTDNYYFASQVASDWKKGFIKDMKIFNGSTTAACPNGYQDAVNFQWSGSGIGCYCSFVGDSAVVLTGFCSSNLIQTGCINIFTQPKINANYWRNKAKICIQRSSVSFQNQMKYDGTNKRCGSSQSLIIVPTSEPCPFVNISFTSFSLQDNFVTAQDTNNMLNPIYLAFNSTSPYSFYSYPISKFKVSEYQFCQMDEDSGLDPDHSDFQLLNYQRGCARVGNYTLLDSMSEIDFYANNPTLNSLTSIRGFPDPANWNYKYGFSSLNGWTYKCRHTYSGKFSIKNALKQFNFAYLSTYNSFVVGLLICVIILGMQVLILALRRCLNSAVYPIGYRQKYLLKHFWLAISRYIIDFCIKFVIFGLTLYNLFLIYQNENWFRTSINLNCSDNNAETLHYILNPFLSLYSKLLRYGLVTFTITIGMIVIDIIHFCYIYRAELSYYIVETQDKIMVKEDQAKQLDWIHQTHNQFNKDELFEKQLPGKNEVVDQFRITMAQNIFERQENNEAVDNVPSKMKKKKKKKISPFKRKDDDDSKDQQMADSLDFGYNYEQSLDMLELQQKPTLQKPEKPKINRKKR